MKNRFVEQNLMEGLLILLLLVAGGLILLFLGGCNAHNHLSDAYGNFEATEVVVSAEEHGRLLSLSANEGDVVEGGQLLGIIDTTMLVLKREQLKASQYALEVNERQVDKTSAVQQAKLDLMQKELDRVRAMLADEAVTQQRFDQAEGEFIIAQRQLSQIQAQKEQVRAEKQVLAAQINALNEQVNRCRVVAPVGGTVLQKYAEAGEMTGAGQPLFKVADMEYMLLRAYIAGSQLDDVVIGQQVEVLIDKGEDDYHRLEGTVTWVAQSAEFTPKIIQTKEERVDLVYAIKVRVANDGRLKIGMPGEVVFAVRN
ncbi:MAG: HlyD family efflux transporter periplasmic adaptor subunit [Bacteroidales bacterium]|nr:HlyD family efflux transporter periplasmic adaptor subunit [Bacteroidales bacterium]